jgi:hypothetical protein
LDRGDRVAVLDANVWRMELAVVSDRNEPTNERPAADLDFDEVESWLQEEREKRQQRFERGVVRQPYRLPGGFPS